MGEAAHKTRLAVLVSGDGANLQARLDAVYVRGEIGGEIAAVVSSNPSAYALTRAAAFKIPAFTAPLKDYESNASRDVAVVGFLKKHRVDYVILAGYLGILTDVFFTEYANRILNIHPALLPKFGGHGYHGLAVHRAVLAAGERESGATVHFVDKGIDTGLIVAQDRLTIESTDTPESLQARILEKIEHPLLVRVVRDLCDGKIRVEQNRVIYES
jgi:phosphoribosylglycinamide formyltransferase-1